MRRLTSSSQARPGAFGDLVRSARDHEELPVPVARRLRAILWTATLVSIPTATLHHFILREHTPDFAKAAVSLGGHWTLATGLILASAAALAVLGILTHGFVQASRKQLLATSAASVAAAVATVPTLLLCLALAVVLVLILVVSAAVLACLFAAILGP